MRRQVDKYTWQDLGSSYLPSEISAAFLAAQLDDIDLVTKQRRDAWNHYDQLLRGAERQNLLRCPVVPTDSQGNGHIYYVLLESLQVRQKVIEALHRIGIQTTFHYVPLHSSPYGNRFRHDSEGMSDCIESANRLLRLPMWYGIDTTAQELVANSLMLIVKNSIN